MLNLKSREELRVTPWLKKEFILNIPGFLFDI